MEHTSIECILNLNDNCVHSKCFRFESFIYLRSHKKQYNTILLWYNKSRHIHLGVVAFFMYT